MSRKVTSSCSLLVSCLFIISVLDSPLQALSLPSHVLSQILPASNQTRLSQLNETIPEDAALEIHCSGEHFGFHPSIADCESAKGYISPDFVQYTWGTRHTGLGPLVFPLPYRIMGDRALCFFQATLVDDEPRIAHASLGQLRRAATALILRCAASGDSQGGVAMNIGGDNNLALSLGIYSPAVQCRGAFGPEWTSCRDILGDMPAGSTRVIFGPRNLPEVQQGLPVAIESSDDKCVAQMFSTGKSDVGAWYHMWAAVTAVFSVCVRTGRGGVFMGLGDHGNIFLTVTSAVTDGTQLSLLTNASLDATA